MGVREVLQFVDEAIYTKTGKHLNDLQRGVIEGTLKRYKYTDMAEAYGCSAGHIKDVGYELLQLLSEVFDEPVDKGNLKSVLERQGNLNISFGERSVNSNRSINSHIIGCVNLGSEKPMNTSDLDPNDNSNRPEVLSENKIEQIKKLREFGLSDRQIAEVLELSIEVVQKHN